MPDPKDPRDRDHFIRKTPPKGVASQIAPAGTFAHPRKPGERPDTWNEDTMTGRGLEPMDEIIERQKDLRKRTDSVPAATARLTAETVRTELKGELAEVRTEMRTGLATMHDHVGELGERVGDLDSRVAGISGQLEVLPVLKDILLEDRRMRNEQQHMTMRQVMTELEVGKERELADVEIKKTRALTEIKEGAAKRKWWRSATMKIVGLVTSGAAITQLIHLIKSWLGH